MSDTHPRRAPREVPSLWEATLDVFEAGQQVIVDRIDLVRAEIGEDILRLAVGSSFVVTAGVLALVGYLTLLAAILVFLARWMSPEAALALGGALHLLVGVTSAAMGLSSLGRMGRPGARRWTHQVPEPAHHG